MARTAEETRESNKIASREYRARKRAEHQQQNVDNVVNDASSSNNGAAISVDVVMTESPKKSLKDRLFGGNVNKTSSSSSSKTSSKRVRTKQPNMLMTMMPVIIGTFVATFLRNLIPDPYKPCAPSQQEASVIISPLCAIIARRIEITGKASQDVIDATNAIVQGLVFGVRSYVTYAQIKESERQETASGGYRTRENIPVTNSGTNGSDVRSNANGVNADTTGQGGDESDGSSEADLFSAMFARDKQGRQRLGLLPSAV